MHATKPESIDAYISGFHGELAERLNAIRSTIATAAPKAVEAISYGMPTFKQHGNLVHFAAAKAHIGFYPAPSGIEAFAGALGDYPRLKRRDPVSKRQVAAA